MYKNSLAQQNFCDCQTRYETNRLCVHLQYVVHGHHWCRVTGFSFLSTLFEYILRGVLADRRMGYPVTFLVSFSPFASILEKYLSYPINLICFFIPRGSCSTATVYFVFSSPRLSPPIIADIHFISIMSIFASI